MSVDTEHSADVSPFRHKHPHSVDVGCHPRLVFCYVLLVIDCCDLLVVIGDVFLVVVIPLLESIMM